MPLDEITISSCNDAQKWDEFINTQTDCLYFSWKFRNTIQKSFGHEANYLMATDAQGAITGVLPLIEMKSITFGHFATSLPFVNYAGLLSSEANSTAIKPLTDQAVLWAQSKNLQHLTLRETHDRNLPKWGIQDHKVSVHLALPDTAEELQKSFKAKLRSQIRRPSKEGATFKRGGINLLDDFYYVFCRNMRDLGTPVYSKKWFTNLLEAFPEQTQLVVIYLQNEPVASCFLIQHGKQMEIPWASSLRKANRFSVNMLLYWEALNYSIEQGCDIFDFGRSNKDSPTLKFKKQWGAQEIPLFWYQWTPQGQDSVRLDPNSGKFDIATRLWQKLPLTVANAVGPHVVKNIP